MFLLNIENGNKESNGKKCTNVYTPQIRVNLQLRAGTKQILIFAMNPPMNRVSSNAQTTITENF